MRIRFDVFINFDGNCREAVAFYAKVFRTEVKNRMTYEEMPPDENYSVAEADKGKIMYACLQIGNMNAMFMDMPSGAPFVTGNNITPTISTDDQAEATRIFNELKEGGTVYAEMGKTFFSELYGMVKDRFGVDWSILYDPESA